MHLCHTNCGFYSQCNIYGPILELECGKMSDVQMLRHPLNQVSHTKPVRFSNSDKCLFRGLQDTSQTLYLLRYCSVFNYVNLHVFMNYCDYGTTFWHFVICFSFKGDTRKGTFSEKSLRGDMM